MRAIVFGATGNVGRHLFVHLRTKGWTVIGTYAQCQTEGLVRFRIEEEDFTQFPVAGSRWDYGIICSAISGIDLCRRDVVRSRAVNVVGTLRLVQWLINAGICPVFLSSDYVFGGDKGGYREADTVDPVTLYGQQKVEVETKLERYHAKTLIVRLSKVVTSDPTDSTLFSEWYRTIRAGKPVVCASDQFFCPTFVEDVVNGLRVLMEMRAEGLYHVCQPKRYDRVTLLEEFCRNTGMRCPAVELRQSAAFGFLDQRGRDTSMSPDKFLKATGFQFTSMGACSRYFMEKVKLCPCA